MSAPCQFACSPWADVNDLPSRCRDMDSAIQEIALADATDVLFNLSGQKYPGYCQETVRPCGRPVTSHHVTALHDGEWGDRSWSGVCSCSHSNDACGCSRLSEITLGQFPVVGVDEVLVDGVILDEAEYRVDDWMYLVRLPDAEGDNRGWPCCQNLNRASTDEDTFEVTFTYGMEPDGAGKRAAAALACQLLRAREGEDCDLPPNVTALTRQGVSLTIQGVVSLLQQGQTGVYEVDLWLRAVNPTGQRRPGGILVPGAGRSARRAGT